MGVRGVRESTDDSRVILDWWTLIMLASPDEVPERCDEEEGDEDDRGVVHGCSCDREE